MRAANRDFPLPGLPIRPRAAARLAAAGQKVFGKFSEISPNFLLPDMSKQINHIYEFGEFRLETSERLLLRNGHPISLTPKAFETLLALVRSGGHLVEKDELMKQIWADAYVEEANLARNVWALRKALADDNDEHRYIETVPKLGYRFVAPVTELSGEANGVVIQRRVRARIVSEEVEDSENPGTPTELQLPTRLVGETTALDFAVPRKRKRRIATWGLLTIAGLVAAIAIAGLIIRNARSRLSPTTIESMAVLPFTNLTNDPELDYVSDGITENLINRLSQKSRLKIIAYNSVFRYKGKRDRSQADREGSGRAGALSW
jgi:DNA-binding winged helix-turn-helix (wHTH) protein